MQKQVSPELLQNLKNLKLLVLDVDGTLTDGGIFLGPGGEEFKRFDAHDGHGIVMLQKVHGLEVMFLSGRNSKAVEQRARELGVNTCLQGFWKKEEALLKALEERTYSPEHVGVMGDDLSDLEIMKLVKFSFAPSNAIAAVREHAHYVTERPGGYGAVREVCDLIINALTAA